MEISEEQVPVKSTFFHWIPQARPFLYISDIQSHLGHWYCSVLNSFHVHKALLLHSRCVFFLWLKVEKRKKERKWLKSHEDDPCQKQWLKKSIWFFYCVQLYLRLKSWINFNLVASNFVWHLDKNVIFNVLRTIINFLKNIAKFYWVLNRLKKKQHIGGAYRLNIGAKIICKSVGFW